MSFCNKYKLGLLLLIFAIQIGNAQDSTLNKTYNNLFLYNTEIGHLVLLSQWGDGNSYLLTGNITPNWVVTSGRTRFAVLITPKVKVRMFKDQESFPIRTPSFMPGIKLYYRLGNEVTNYKYLSWLIFHHSNGQDGEFFNEDGSVNVNNGNFSTNFFEAGFHFGNLTDGGNRSNKVSIEVHTGAFGALAIDEESLQDRYGFVRLNYRFYNSRFFYRKTRERTEELWRLAIEGTFIFGDMGQETFWSRLNVESKVFFKIPSSQNFAVFASLGWVGQDSYNIYFQNSYWLVRAGITASSSFIFRNNNSLKQSLVQ